MSEDTTPDTGRAPWHNEIVYQAVQLGVSYETANAWNTKEFGDQYDWPKFQKAVLAKAKEVAAEKIAQSVIDFIAGEQPTPKFEHPDLAAELIERVNQVLDLGFWTEPIVEPCVIWFRTASPIVLWNDRTFEHRRIGYVAIKVDLDKYDATAWACGLNQFTGGRFHPHLWERGRICYGSEYANAYEAQKQRDLAKLVLAIQSCICSYTIGYLPINQIAGGVRQIQATPYGNRYDK